MSYIACIVNMNNVHDYDFDCCDLSKLRVGNISTYTMKSLKKAIK